MAIELDLQIHNKKRIAIMGGLLALISIYAVSDISTSKNREPYVAANTTKSSVVNNPDNDEVFSYASSPDQAVNINPFIEIKEYNPEVENISDLTSTDTYNSNITRSKPGIPLPAIPNYNGPASYHVQTPLTSPIPSNIKNEEPQQSITVKGIGTGEGGNNIAILSDGRVVTEGDTYNDGRIAYIGGDGITFDDGKKLQYK